jgi:hypothetical protein
MCPVFKISKLQPVSQLSNKHPPMINTHTLLILIYGSQDAETKHADQAAYYVLSNVETGHAN